VSAGTRVVVCSLCSWCSVQRWPAAGKGLAGKRGEEREGALDPVSCPVLYGIVRTDRRSRSECTCGRIMLRAELARDDGPRLLI
jgi:hypothetical protein